MLKISFDLGHPAHFLFFRDILKNHEKLNFKPVIFIQEKDRLESLLKEESFSFYKRFNKGTTISRASLMLKDIIQIRNIMKKEKISFNIGKSSIIGSIAAKSLGLKAVVFDDTDNSKIETFIYSKFADEILCPKYFPLNLGSKQIFFNGLFPLAYLSPQVFKPDRTIPNSLGLLERGKPIMIRLIAYNATHDWNYRDYREDFFKIIKKLEKEFDIILSIEGNVFDKKLEKYVKKFDAKDFHHILAFSKLYIGSGASTAQEASVLGVPSLYTNPITPFYIKLLNKKYKLIKLRSINSLNIQMINEVLKIDEKIWQSKKNNLLNDMINMPDFLRNYIKNLITKYNN